MTEHRNAHVVAWLRDRKRQAERLRAREATEIAAQLIPAPSELRARLLFAGQKVDGAKLTVELARSKDGRRAAKRALVRAEAEHRVADAAVRAEERHEALAPRVQRMAITAGPLVLREARVQVSPNGRVMTQPALDRMFIRGTIPKHCLHAGRRYRDAYEQAHRDLFPTALGEAGGGSGSASSGNRRIEEATACSIALSSARAALGSFSTAVIEHVVIYDLTLGAWTERRGDSEQAVKGFLRTALERLAEHWAEVDLAAANPAAKMQRAEFR